MPDNKEVEVSVKHSILISWAHELKNLSTIVSYVADQGDAKPVMAGRLNYVAKRIVKLSVNIRFRKAANAVSSNEDIQQL